MQDPADMPHVDKEARKATAPSDFKLAARIWLHVYLRWTTSDRDIYAVRARGLLNGTKTQTHREVFRTFTRMFDLSLRCSFPGTIECPLKVFESLVSCIMSHNRFWKTQAVSSSCGFRHS